ncbi:hypothetical protein D9V37_03360 [Nocardioides mangrovicus]|uniref:Glycosyltransferase RgtA/B/C/D-like domain-containing protein n=1 Tax=Nocardioides mangrovicus TaxID=2478913 RepID=A0A3L8P6U8_9ACTN|nr:hypothetical protein [Nocardioides mangrovicus]RLV50981.1 hypothetical protein D9V37_03360 [Nocardioides mangrovicus]
MTSQVREHTTPSPPAPVDALVTQLVRLMPTLMLVALVFLVTKKSSETVSNPDTFFHLRFGHEFLDGWSIWDPGSVTHFATAPWVPTQWLAEMAMAKVEDWFGLPGIAWITGAGFVALTLVVYLACRRVSGAWVSTTIAALMVIAASDGLSARPQQISYLLVVVYAEAWRRTSRDARPRWWLLAPAWFWPMLHGMWPLGIVVSAVAALGIVADRRATLSRRQCRDLLALPVSMAVVSALTPVGPKIYPAVLLVADRGRYYTEWQPPDFHRVPEIALMLLFAVVLVVRIRTGTRSWYVLGSIVVAAGFCVYSSRTVPVAAGLLALQAAAALGEITDRAQATRRRDGLIAHAVAGAGLVGLACAVPFTAAHPAPKPAWIDSEISALPAGTSLLNDDQDGGYLMWRYPQVQIWAHGYGDAFTLAQLHRTRQLVDLSPGWPRVLRASGIRYALLDPTEPLAYALVHDQGWHLEHRSKDYAWLVAPGAG